MNDALVDVYFMSHVLKVDRNHDLLNKYEEQTLQLEEMNREIRDLRHQLGDHHTGIGDAYDI